MYNPCPPRCPSRMQPVGEQTRKTSPSLMSTASAMLRTCDGLARRSVACLRWRGSCSAPEWIRRALPAIRRVGHHTACAADLEHPGRGRPWMAVVRDAIVTARHGWGREVLARHGGVQPAGRDRPEGSCRPGEQDRIVRRRELESRGGPTRRRAGPRGPLLRHRQPATRRRRARSFSGRAAAHRAITGVPVASDLLATRPKASGHAPSTSLARAFAAVGLGRLHRPRRGSGPHPRVPG